MVTFAELAQFAAERHRAGDWEQAEQAYRELLKHAPQEAGLRHDLAWLLHQRGATSEAIDQLEQAIATKPNEGSFHSHLATMLRRAGRSEEAIVHLQTALRLEPNSYVTHFNLGNALQQTGRFQEAADSYRAALAGATGDPDIHLNLGVAQKTLGQLAEARRSFERVLELNPEAGDGWINLGLVSKLEGRLAEAETCYRRALELKPSSGLAHNNLGSVLQAQGRLDEAALSFQQACRLDPAYAGAYANLAETLHKQGQPAAARACYAEILRCAPTDALRIKAALVLPVIPESSAEIDEAQRRLHADLTRLSHEPLTVADPVRDVGLPAFYLAYQGRNERNSQTQIAEILRRASPALAYVAPHCTQNNPQPRQRLKIGFVSQHFHAHTIGKLNAGLIRELDRERFEVVVLRLPSIDDGMAQFITESADRCVTLPTTLAPARDAIAGEELDVLYFTDIGMDDLTYYLAHARLAPVQCVTWGHPLTTGISTIDYFISSRDLEPDEAQEHYTERLVRLPHLTNYYYKPTPARHGKTRAAFGFAADAHLFVCPQTLFKLHPDNDVAFGEILRRDPLARIVLIEGKEPAWTHLLRRRHERAMGALAERIQLIPFQTLPNFRQLLALADVILDPLHFGGGDTSYEAFAVGTPIVTLPGAFLRSRITYALYRAMGVSEGIATDAGDYVERAVRLATDPAWRKLVRGLILAANSVLYENRAGIVELEDFLVAAVRSRYSALAPDS